MSEDRSVVLEGRSEQHTAMYRRPLCQRVLKLGFTSTL